MKKLNPPHFLLILTALFIFVLGVKECLFEFAAEDTTPWLLENLRNG